MPASGMVPRARRLITLCCYLAGFFAPFAFALSVIVGGARQQDYSHLVDPVSALGRSGAANAMAINRAWTATGLLVLALGIAMWRDGRGRAAAGAVMLAGAASAAIALWCPMDPPGLPMSLAQLGHTVLVAATAVALATAILTTALSAATAPACRRLSWMALAAMLGGGTGAALSAAFGWPLIGLFERITQTGYHGWLLMIAATGLAGALSPQSAPAVTPASPAGTARAG